MMGRQARLVNHPLARRRLPIPPIEKMTLKILIIDDEADLAVLLSNLLSREHKVFTSGEGGEGLKLFKKQLQ